jgi:hypothetical protein
MYHKICNKQDGCLHEGQGSPKDIQTIRSHQVVFVLWQHFHLISCYTMLIKILRISISCKDILDSYNKKSLIFYIVSLLRFIIKEI